MYLHALANVTHVSGAFSVHTVNEKGFGGVRTVFTFGYLGSDKGHAGDSWRSPAK